jgi:hypothetical protein
MTASTAPAKSSVDHSGTKTHWAKNGHGMTASTAPAKSSVVTASTATAAEGTLHRWILDFLALGDDSSTRSTADVADEKHITKWGRSMMDGWDVFTRDLLRDWSHAKLMPLVFAIMANGEPFIQVAHCFGQMALETEDYAFDGVLGCFLGDCTIMPFQGDLVIQEPDFVALRDTTAIQGISTKPAGDGAIQRIGASGDFVKGNAQADEVDLPLCLPLPLMWVPYFLETQQKNNKAYIHMSEHMDMWEGSKEMGTMMRGWFWVACTRHPSAPNYSILDIGTRTSANHTAWAVVTKIVDRPHSVLLDCPIALASCS